MENYLQLAYALAIALLFAVLSIVYIRVTLAINLICFASMIIGAIIIVLGPNRHLGVEIFTWSIIFYFGYWLMMMISTVLLAIVGAPVLSLYLAFKLLISEFKNNQSNKK